MLAAVYPLLRLQRLSRWPRRCGRNDGSPRSAGRLPSSAELRSCRATRSAWPCRRLRRLALPRSSAPRPLAVRRGARLELGPGPTSPAFARATAAAPVPPAPTTTARTSSTRPSGGTTPATSQAADGRRFGFQLTFFRRGLSPGPPPDGPGLATNQVYFAHFAITDVARGPPRRGRALLAAARAAWPARAASRSRVWLEDWRAEALERRRQRRAPARATRRPASSLDLELEATKPLVAHGDRGLSPKSDEPGNASYYVGYTRMARARPHRHAAAHPAARGRPGEAWFDHEWSTSALGAGRRRLGLVLACSSTTAAS